MHKKKIEFMINYNKVKDIYMEKEQTEVMELYERMFTYLEREANVREKVRAKHLFRHKLSITDEEPFSYETELHFEHWMLFDYVTVTGSRLFDLYVRKYKNDLNTRMLHYCGLLMTTFLEPLYIERKEQEFFICYKSFENNKKMLKVSTLLIDHNLPDRGLIFARLLQGKFQDIIIGPCIKISEEHEQEVLAKLKFVQEQKKEGYRKYLKENGISLLKFQDD